MRRLTVPCLAFMLAVSGIASAAPRFTHNFDWAGPGGPNPAAGARNLIGPINNYAEFVNPAVSNTPAGNSNYTAIRGEQTFAAGVGLRSEAGFGRGSKGPATPADHYLLMGRNGFNTVQPGLTPNARANAMAKGVGTATGAWRMEFDLWTPFVPDDGGSPFGGVIQVGDNYNANDIGAQTGLNSFARVGVRTIPPNTPGSNPNPKPAYSLYWFDDDGMAPGFDWTGATNGSRSGPVIPGDIPTRVSWILNGSGANIPAYAAPDGAVQGVADDTYDIFMTYDLDGAGPGLPQTIQFVDDAPAQTAGTALNDFNMFIASSLPTRSFYAFDNLTIDDVVAAAAPMAPVFPGGFDPFAGFPVAVPEPGTVMLMGGVLLVMRRR